MPLRLSPLLLVLLLTAPCGAVFAADPAGSSSAGSGSSASASPPKSSAASSPAEGIERLLDERARQGRELERRLREERVREKRRLLESRRGRSRNEVIVMGSSSVRGALGHHLAGHLEREGFKAVLWGRSASGLSRLDYYDWFDAVVDMPITDRTAGVIVYLGVNDPQGIWLYPNERRHHDKWLRFQHEEEWSAKYLERVVMLIDALCNLGVPRVAMLTPVDVRWDRLQRRLVRIRRLQIEGARRSTCGFAVSGSGDALFFGEPTPARLRRRLRDGYHLTGFGAEIVWDRIKYRVLRRLRGQPWMATPDVPDVRELARRRPMSLPPAERPGSGGSAGGRSAPQEQ